VCEYVCVSEGAREGGREGECVCEREGGRVRVNVDIPWKLLVCALQCW
jgi:hypothetical protein